MLVLSRRKNERIRIGDDIEIKVLDIRGDRIRLGIVAPMEVPVMRHELLFDENELEGAALPCSRYDDPVFARAEEPVRNDTLRAGAARTARNQPTLPR